MDIFVSEAEIKRMTGKKDKSGQCRSLATHWKIPYRKNPVGWPIVLKSDVEKALGLGRLLQPSADRFNGSRIDEPNFSAMS